MIFLYIYTPQALNPIFMRKQDQVRFHFPEKSIHPSAHPCLVSFEGEAGEIAADIGQKSVSHTHIKTYRQFRVSNQPNLNLHVFGVTEEDGVNYMLNGANHKMEIGNEGIQK